MKKLFFIISLICAMASVHAQKTEKDVFSKEKLIWYGLDFSQARFVGQFDQGAGAAPATAQDIKQKYIPAWNKLVIDEPNKFDIKNFFRKPTVIYDIAPVEKNNDNINEDKLLDINEFSFTNPNSVVEKIVNGYSKGDNAEGLGLVFIVESVNKANVEMRVYVTYFDIASHQVIFSEKVTGKPRGIGLRNYWGGAVFDVMEMVEKYHYGVWKRKYLK